MEITALGMIETSGLLSAIEAADAGLKAADVRLLGTDYVRGGLVMVRFEGEVAAVRSAVDAGTAAAKRIGNVVSSHVIPRAMPEVFCMLASDIGAGPAKMRNNGCAACGGCEGGMREMRACEKRMDRSRGEEVKASETPDRTRNGADNAPEGKRESAGNAGTADGTRPSLDEMKKWKVVALRSYVRKLEGFGMKAGEIRFANKEQLISALEAYLKK